MKGRLGIDVDGTLADNLGAFVDLFNEETGKNIHVDDVWDFDLSKVYGIHPETAKELYEARPDLVFEQVPPFRGAADAIRELRGEGFEIYLVTARPDRFRDVTEKWLAEHGFPYDKLFFEPDKAKACREYGLSLFVDDHIRNIVGVAQNPTPGVIVDAPHNRFSHSQISPAWSRAFKQAPVSRMHDWNEFKGLVFNKLAG